MITIIISIALVSIAINGLVNSITLKKEKEELARLIKSTKLKKKEIIFSEIHPKILLRPMTLIIDFILISTRQTNM